MANNEKPKYRPGVEEVYGNFIIEGELSLGDQIIYPDGRVVSSKPVDPDTDQFLFPQQPKVQYDIITYKGRAFIRSGDDGAGNDVYIRQAPRS